MMFTKLPQIFTTTNVDWDNFKTDECTSKFYSEKRKGGGYFYKIKNLETFMSLLKPNIFSIPCQIFYSEFTGAGLVTPHIDKGTTVALNFYLETDNSTTIFYEGNVPEKLYYENNIREVSRFTADQYDCYLLDVSKIHGVLKTSDKTRSMFSFRWENYDFQTILESIRV